jgi:low affinity Fe/Cu permease
MTPARSPSWFVRFATHASRAAARPAAFAAALSLVVAWALSGPFLGFTNTWQLLINTGTTIMTFLMVFLIQNTQYRDSEALHIKLDELIRATRGASNELLDLEELDEEELRRILQRYERLAAGARSRLRRG